VHVQSIITIVISIIIILAYTDKSALCCSQLTIYRSSGRQKIGAHSYTIYRMVPLSTTLSDLWPGFQGHDIFWSRISEKRTCLKEKVTIAQQESIQACGMVLCLVTLADL